MAQTENYSLSWHAHQKNICNGLSILQQRGEFVDMTLAADGHHVKVHQMVLSLVSPYIKDLISSAQCPHPVIFLNNISYSTLCAILEYIYTGEVLVPKHKLPDLIAAGKALHIKGLREVQETKSVDPVSSLNISTPNQSISENLKKEKKKNINITDEAMPPVPICKVYLPDNNSTLEESAMDTTEDISKNISITDTFQLLNNSNNKKTNNAVKPNYDLTSEDLKKSLCNSNVQFTISIQGGLQAIYNRYIYNLRYFGKTNRTRLWRCIDYANLKCPANIITNESSKVVDRSYTHNHPFHDKKILKKLRMGNIYQKFHEAQSNVSIKKKEKNLPITETPESNSE